ncbi:MAG: hemolysin III family protein [Rhodospirillales bacterium]|nr:hemolysin III family protein [Rhodospirillales bacterium]
MATTDSIGLSRRVNYAVLGATVAFAAGGAAALIPLAVDLPSPGSTIAILVYGATLLACALCSFLYNTFEGSRRRRLLRRLDHACIFLFIAGTYTPFAAIALENWGTGLLVFVWCLAVLGAGLKVRVGDAWDRPFVWIYLALGWVFLAFFDELMLALDATALALLVGGGAAYTVGALIYHRDIGHWTDPLWHTFVLAGTAAHFFAVIEVAA